MLTAVAEPIFRLRHFIGQEVAPQRCQNRHGGIFQDAAAPHRDPCRSR